MGIILEKKNNSFGVIPWKFLDQPLNLSANTGVFYKWNPCSVGTYMLDYFIAVR